MKASLHPACFISGGQAERRPPAGRTAINRQQVEAQIEGCIAQAIGYALTEDFRIANGRILTPHFSNYLLPTALDVPAQIYSVIMETPDPQGPFGARGMSEMPLVPFGAAVASAIHHATGAWVSDMPFTPERVLAASRFLIYQNRVDHETALFAGKRLDTLRLTDGAWKLARREITLDQSVLLVKNLTVFF